MTYIVGILLLYIGLCSALSCQHRRSFLRNVAGTAFGLTPAVANAAADCFGDCFKNCKLIAPKDLQYCKDNCSDYCSQPDRQDGLSGSVSASSGEVGILGGTFGQGTVVKGQDKPPTIALPGLDFTNESGKKLLGY